jgi:hypothetical protein
MFYPARSLLDQITVLHGPHKLLGRYFPIAVQQARALGVELRLTTDFERIQAIRQRHADTPVMTAPHFDPTQSAFHPNTACWLEGVDAAGDTVLTHGMRRFHWPRTTLKEEVEALRVHYRDPAPHLAAGESVTLDCPSANRITGLTALAGAMWVRSDYRRRGLTRIVPRISRTYAFTRWDTSFTWGFMRPHLHEGGASRAYGRYTVEAGMRVNLAFWKPFDALLLWMSRDTLLAEIAEIVAQRSTDLSRRIERPRTKISPVRLRQGSSTRL